MGCLSGSLEFRVGSEGLEGLEGTKLSKHPKLSKLIFFTLELELVTRTPTSSLELELITLTSLKRKQQEAFVCLYRLSHLPILGNKVGNTTDSVLVMGERWGRYGCKDCLYRVKGSWAMGVRS